MAKFSELAEIKSGYKINQSDYIQSGIRVLTAGDIKDSYSIIISENRFIDESENRINHLLENGDILMVCVGSKIGNSAIFYGEEATIANQNLLVIKPNILPQDLLEKIIENRILIAELAKGVAMQSITIKELLDLELS